MKQRKLCREFWRHDYDPAKSFKKCLRCGTLGIDAPLEERILNKIQKDGPTPASRLELGSCWVWLGSKQQQGYGFYRFSKERIQVAHRAVYELLRGPIPDGLVLDHLCLNKSCVNPGHVEAVRQRENLARAKNFTKCIRGHDVTLPNAFYYYGKPDADGIRKRRCRECLKLSGELAS